MTKISNQYSLTNVLFADAVNGRVGIGTASPSYALQVSAATGTNVTPQINAVNTTTNGYGILRLTGASRGGFIDFYDTSTAQASIVGQGGALGFYTNGDSSGTAKVTISSAGNVGIGTTSPSAKLEVQQSTDNYGYGYSLKNIAGNNWQWVNGGDNNLYIGYNTATKLFIGSAGNVGINNTSPSGKFQVNNTSTQYAIYDSQGNFQVWQPETTASGTQVRLGSAYNLPGVYSNTQLNLNSDAGNAIAFHTNGATERMRITSGGTLCINQTGTVGSEALEITPKISGGGQYGIIISGSPNSYVNYAMRFYYINVAVVGSITFTTSATSYNTGSDYRLKEDLKPINGLEKVSAIKVYDFKWKTDGTRMDGVIAHELAEILPYAVHGVKDGKEYQAVDYSKIVPVLVSAVQQQQTQINELKALLNA